MNTYSCRIKNAAGEHAQKFVSNARYHPFYFSFAFINQTPIQCISISSNYFLFYFFRLANQTPISPYQALLFFFFDWLIKHLYLHIKHSFFILFIFSTTGYSNTYISISSTHYLFYFFCNWLIQHRSISPYEALSFFFLRLANTYISISSTHFLIFFCDWLIKHLYLHIKHSFFIFIYFLQLAKQTPISPYQALIFFIFFYFFCD